MDWRTWIRQSLPRTEIMRGGATVWEKGAKGLLGDTLGPVMHAHDKASEIVTAQACQANDPAYSSPRC